MKILTKEEEAAHYNATVKGGLIGGIAGLTVGTGAVYLASMRFPAFAHLTLPMKTFLITSSGTFASIISADSSSRAFESNRDPTRKYRDRASKDLDAVRAQESSFQKFKEWGRENRYPIVGVSWVFSMGAALWAVGKDKYLTKAQKLVQARVYAQGLTVAVLLATAAFEVGDAGRGKGRWETVKVVDPSDPEHKKVIEKKVHHEAYKGEDLWRDMVATEERKIAQRKQTEVEIESEDNNKAPAKKEKNGKKSSNGSKESKGSNGSKGSKDEKESKSKESKDADESESEDEEEESGDEKDSKDSKESKKGPKDSKKSK